MITCLLWVHLTSGAIVQRALTGQVIMEFDSESVEVKFDVDKLQELGVYDAESYHDKIVERSLCRAE